MSMSRPFPKFQMTVLLVAHMADSIVIQVIYPFISQLVSEMGIPRKQVGYYVGLIDSFYYGTGAITILQWSRLSDYIGRKPVLLIGLASLSTSILLFGLAESFWGLVISRCISSLLNGKLGVVKSTIGELTDPTNIAHGFALMRVARSVGETLGPFIGGSLSRPHDHFPMLFGGAFWIRHPYFLPCLVTALYATFACVLVTLCLRETVTRGHQERYRRTRGSHADPAVGLLTATSDPAPEDDEDHDLQTRKPHTEPVPLRELFVPRVLMPLANYMYLAFLSIAFAALQPLFYATPIDLGGLGLPPSTIGVCLGTMAFATGFFQVMFFDSIVRRWGAKRVFVFGLAAFLPIFLLFPLMNAIARVAGGLSKIVWAMVLLQLALVVVMDMSYSCIFIYITSSAPNKRSLGATNGLALTSVAISRSIGPATSTSLFAYSLERGSTAGYAIVLGGLVCGAFAVAKRLPEDPWAGSSADDEN